MDERLALGMARSGARRLDGIMDVKTAEFYTTVYRMLEQRCRSGRRQTPENIRALMTEAQRIVGRDMRPVVHHAAYQPATRARPKGELHEQISLHLVPHHDPAGIDHGLWAFRMQAGVRRIIIDTVYTGLDISLHAVQRLIERSDGLTIPGIVGSPDDAVFSIASKVVPDIGMLYAVMETARRGDRSLAFGMPLGPGMICGTVEPKPIGQEPTMLRLTYDNRGFLGTDLRHPTLAMATMDDGTPAFWKVTLRSYVSGVQMSRRQHEFTDRWLDLRHNHPVLEEWGRSKMWPDNELCNPPQQIDPNALAGAVEAVANFVDNEEYQAYGPVRTGGNRAWRRPEPEARPSGFGP